jgi:glycosyltransferase involved in cell wall biosynthesis
MKAIKILLAHNRYLISGGERQVFEGERGLLRDNGHEIEEYIEDNQRVVELGQARTAVRTIWSNSTYKKVRMRLRQGSFDIVHVHNFFPLISPSIYYAAQAEGVPVVQTLHNFRLLCLNGFLFRDGAVCEDCVGRIVPWPGVRHACYRDSYAGSATVAAMLSFHRALKTWDRMVDTYIALTEFSRQKLIDGGLPGSKIAIKPNFIPHDPGQGMGRGDFALYVGRLSPEKGIETLLSAWRTLDVNILLKIAGDGPLSELVSTAAGSSPAIEYLGRVSNDQVLNLMQDAMMLLFPSEWYENFPVTIIEAFAAGLPIIASNIGNTATLIQDRQTGLRFKPGDAADLAGQVKWMTQHSEAREKMRIAVRKIYEQEFSPQQNYYLLRTIYEDVLVKNNQGRKEDGANKGFTYP